MINKHLNNSKVPKKKFQILYLGRRKRSSINLIKASKCNNSRKISLRLSKIQITGMMSHRLSKQILNLLNEI